MLVKRRRRSPRPRIDSPAVEVEAVSQGLGELTVDVVAVALAEGAELPEEIRSAPGADSAKADFKKAVLIHPAESSPVLAIGIGPQGELDAERLRVAAAVAARQAAELDARSLAWMVPEGIDAAAAAAAFTEGTILATYRFDRFRTAGDGEAERSKIDRLVIASAAEEREAVATEARIAAVAATAANRARDLQNLPANELTPAALATRAEEIAANREHVEVEVLDREAIVAAGMGGLVAVSQGTATEPRFIALRYTRGGGERIGLVGKAVTFDSGGISIKPSSGMHEMKMDMSGGAAVLEAFDAIAELDLELDLVAAIPATENMPSGSAIKPGDVITQLNGKTVEVNNTDAEGRLILADALTYCVRELGAERVVDIATLTGAVLIALGSTYAGLMSNDDDWAQSVLDAASDSGELAWRLPLHPEYKQITKGTVADLTNASAKRKAGTIYAGSFLEEFVDDVPWVHLDIAGTAWDSEREYAGKGPTGFGVCLLVGLATELAQR